MNTSGVTFEKKVTLGNILMLFVMVGGGVGFLIANESRLKEVETKVAGVERTVQGVEEKLRESGRAIAVIDERANAKIEVITRDLSDAKVTLRGIETSIDFLVQQERIRAQGGIR